MTDDRTTTRTVGDGPAATTAGHDPAGREPPEAKAGPRRRGVTERQRPLWLLIPAR
jgi:multiple sugar transport system permease protein